MLPVETSARLANFRSTTGRFSSFGAVGAGAGFELDTKNPGSGSADAVADALGALGSSFAAEIPDIIITANITYKVDFMRGSPKLDWTICSGSDLTLASDLLRFVMSRDYVRECTCTIART